MLGIINIFKENKLTNINKGNKRFLKDRSKVILNIINYK